jgi:hypothetical protein
MSPKGRQPLQRSSIGTDKTRQKVFNLKGTRMSVARRGDVQSDCPTPCSRPQEDGTTPTQEQIPTGASPGLNSASQSPLRKRGKEASLSKQSVLSDLEETELSAPNSS